MPQFHHHTGNILCSDAHILVNTVNCVGVMGAGLAKQFKARYPDMFHHYKQACQTGRLKPGGLHIWHQGRERIIVNFPTKNDWHKPSEYAWIEQGLVKLNRWLEANPHYSAIAIPPLGAGLGGLDKTRVLAQIETLLTADITVQLYNFRGWI